MGTSSFTQQTFFSKKLLFGILAIVIATMGMSVAITHRVDAAPGSDTCEWTGAGANNNWNTSLNWSGCSAGVPVDGDSLDFSVSPARTTSVNNITGLDLTKITIEADNMTISGSDITIDASAADPQDQTVVFDISGTGNTFAINFTLTGTTSLAINTEFTNTISGDIALDITDPGALDFNGGDLSDDLTVSGDISGTSGQALYTNVSGQMTLSGNNTFVTPNIVMAGNTTCASATCVGDASNVISGTGGTLTFSTASTFANSIAAVEGSNTIDVEADVTFSSGVSTFGAGNLTLLSESGVATTVATGYFGGGTIEISAATNATTTFSGSMILTQDTTITLTGGIDLAFTGTITGTGNLIFEGDGTVGQQISMSGSADNDYVGSTSVYQVRSFVINKDDNVIAIPGNLTIEGDQGVTTEADVEGSENFANDSHVTLQTSNGGAIFSMATIGTETIGMLEGNGNVILPHTFNILNVGADNSSGEFFGTVSGVSGATVHKVGTGDWKLSGSNNTSTGYVNYSVDDGKMIANFPDNSARQLGFIITGGIFGGTGIVGGVDGYTNAGSVAVGNSPGCMQAISTVTLPSSPGTFAVDIDSPTPCTGYDQLNSNNDADLNGSTLVTHTTGFTPVDGTVFTIITGSTITGTFDGLADGDIVAVGAFNYRLNYNSTSVTLTAVVPAAVTTTTTTVPSATVPIPTTSTAAALPTTGIAVGASVLTASLLIMFGILMRRRRKLI